MRNDEKGTKSVSTLGKIKLDFRGFITIFAPASRILKWIPTEDELYGGKTMWISRIKKVRFFFALFSPFPLVF